jgi:hypothetical protein
MGDPTVMPPALVDQLEDERDLAGGGVSVTTTFQAWVARHEREGEYPCPWDGHDRTFRSPAGLRAHLDEHHDGHMPALECPRQDCDEIFPTRPELVAHLQAGHPPWAAVEESAEWDAAEEGGSTMAETLTCRKTGCGRTFTGPARESNRRRHENGPAHAAREARRGGRKTGRKRGRAEVDRSPRSTPVPPAAPPNGQVDQELATLNRILQDVAGLSPHSRVWLHQRLTTEIVGAVREGQ